MIITTQSAEDLEAQRRKESAAAVAALRTARAETARLDRFIRLEARIRSAETRRELGYVLLNDLTAVADYRQAALWWRAPGDSGSGRIEGLSGVADPVRNGAFPAWLAKMLGAFADKSIAADEAEASPGAPAPASAGGRVLDFELAAPTAHDLEMAEEYLPAHALWVELDLPAPGDAPGCAPGRAGRNAAEAIRAALIFWRTDPWTPVDRALMGLIAPAAAHAWGAIPCGRADWAGEKTAAGRLRRAAALGRRPWVKWAAAAALLALMALPVRQSVLAPAEAVPLHPFAVRAPLAGVVEEIAVAPNAAVKAGDVLVRMDARELRGRLEAARQALSVAEAEYRQSQQQAFFDDRSKMALGVLKRRCEQAVHAALQQAAGVPAGNQLQVVALQDGAEQVRFARELIAQLETGETGLFPFAQTGLQRGFRPERRQIVVRPRQRVNA